MKRRGLPKWCSEYQDRHGKWRVRARRVGFRPHTFKSPPGTDEFADEYRRWLAGAAVRGDVGASRTDAGTINAVCVSYYGSPEFRGVKATTQGTYRGIIERFREAHGDKPVAALDRKHIKAIIGAKHATPSAANKLLIVVRMLLNHALDIGLTSHNPAIGIKGFKITSGGHHTWTEDEIATFQGAYALGTKPRLALEIMLNTGMRPEDARRFGRQNVTGGWARYKQQKTGTEVELPVSADLAAALARAPRDNLTFIVTDYGAPFTPKGFSQWFSRKCNEIGLRHCTGHGLRKSAGTRLAEAGCTQQQIKAITGHKTDKEVRRYVEAASRRHMAEQAHRQLAAADNAKMANPEERLAKKGDK